MSKQVKNSRPAWMDDDDFKLDNLPVVFNSLTPVHTVTFLNEGVKGVAEIEVQDKDGNYFKKEVKCVEYKVTELGKEKVLNPISKQFIQDLASLYPLTDRTFRIQFIEGRTQFENKYQITEVK